LSPILNIFIKDNGDVAENAVKVDGNQPPVGDNVDQNEVLEEINFHIKNYNYLF